MCLFVECVVVVVADVCLVTSLRDGMNLVSYEYVACQNSKKGVLILSEVSHRPTLLHTPKQAKESQVISTLTKSCT